MRKRLGTELRVCNVNISLSDAVSRRDLVRLASSQHQIAVRITGGAASMSRQEGENVAEILANALGGAQCSASVLAGATMSIDRPDSSACDACNNAKMHCLRHMSEAAYRPGVMDILPRLAQLGAPGKTIGIAPTVSSPVLWGGHLVVSNKPTSSSYTVVDPRCPVCVLVQFNADRPGLTWDDEWKVCLEYLQLLRDEGDHRSLHLVYNGGQTTRNEVLHVAGLKDQRNPWWVLLVADSGREATKLASDRAWRAAHPHVVSCTKADLKTVVREMGFA